MLELFGQTYVIEHCLNEWKQKEEEKAYRVYITDALFLLSKKMGIDLQTRYFDLFEVKPKDTRTGKEIAADVIKRAGLKVVTDNS